MNFCQALRRERDELFAICDQMESRVVHGRGRFGPRFAESRLRADEAIAAATHPVAVEQALEDFTREIRHVWLECAASAASRTFRSPCADDTAKTQTGTVIEFGYERDLQPTLLEHRCEAFFGETVEGWYGEHLLFSSGQGAMGACLLSLDGDRKTPARIAHFGAYFETAALLKLFPSMLHPVDPRESFDVAIVEPLWCDGQFGLSDLVGLAERIRGGDASPHTIIVDSTLVGHRDNAAAFLRAMGERPDITVLRLHSGLKLFQSGLELANVGILSVFGCDQGKISAQAARLRSVRTLLDSGLRLSDVAALDLPIFLDRAATRRYQIALFEHNAALAQSVRSRNAIFREVHHPSFETSEMSAPYCVFQLLDDSEAAYDLLDRRIEETARDRQVLLARGGSFGFRGHRFEVVRPDGKAPFLRVAMGHRGGWSCDGIVEMFGEIAAG